MDVLLKILSGIAIATVSAVITVRLSTQKFRTERWWDKKVGAYERVLEAFHNAKKFNSEHLRAAQLASDLSDEREAELTKLANDARDEIARASDIGSFVLSNEAQEILSNYSREIDSVPRQDTWWEHLDIEWEITNRRMKEFIAEAHRDLKR